MIDASQLEAFARKVEAASTDLKPYMGKAPLLEASSLPKVRQPSTKELPALYQSRKLKVQKCRFPKMR